jgi:hypothetical protein
VCGLHESSVSLSKRSSSKVPVVEQPAKSMGGKISHPSVSTILPIADNGSSTATSSKNSPKNAAKDLEKTEMQLDLEEELEAKRWDDN